MTSNDRLGVVEPDRPHPLREMVDTGLFCTVNSDDPPMFGSSLKQLPDFRLRSQSRQLRAFVVRLTACSAIKTDGRVSLFLHTDDSCRDFGAFESKGVVFIRNPKEERYGTVAVFKDLDTDLWDWLQLK